MVRSRTVIPLDELFWIDQPWLYCSRWITNKKDSLFVFPFLMFYVWAWIISGWSRECLSPAFAKRKVFLLLYTLNLCHSFFRPTVVHQPLGHPHGPTNYRMLCWDCSENILPSWIILKWIVLKIDPEMTVPPSPVERSAGKKESHLSLSLVPVSPGCWQWLPLCLHPPKVPGKALCPALL